MKAERKSNIDLLRIISAIAVVTIHIVTSSVNETDDTNLLKNLNLIHNMMLWAIPVFFMITGYCLMKKEECTYQYCLKHVSKYITVLFTVGFLYTLAEQVFYKGSFGIEMVNKSIANIISGNLWAHMWFIYAIIGIYLVMPVLHNFLKNRNKEFYILTFILFIFTIFLPALSQFFLVGIQLPFGGYLFYVCYGGVIADNKIYNMKENIIYFFGIFALLWIIFDGKTRTMGYMDLNVALIAIAIFTLINRLHMKPNEKIRIIVDCTWGIYLIHPLFINLVIKVIKIDVIGRLPFINLLLYEIGVLLISFITVILLKRIPFINRII